MQPDTGAKPIPAHERSRFFSRRLIFSIVVFAAWIAAMRGVWLHETGRGGQGLKQLGVSPEVLLVTWTNYDHLLWIMQNNTRIGATQMTIVRREDPKAPKDKLPGYELTSRTRMKPRMMGLPLPVDISLDVGMNSSFEMETLQGSILVAGQPMRLDAFVEGNRLYYRARIGDASTTSPMSRAAGSMIQKRDVCGRSPLSGPILMQDTLLPLVIHEGRLRAGQSWTTESSDPIAGLLHQNVRINVVGQETIKPGEKEIPVWHLTERVGETETQAYYDLNGHPVRRDAPGGLTMLMAEADAVKKFDPGFSRAPYLAPIDREYIRTHIDPKLDNKPLETLLPGLPAM